MLPLMLFSAAYGVGPGLLAGMAYGVLQYLQGGWFMNVWQFLLDYVLAFAALGLCGLYKQLPKTWGLYVTMAFAALCRALSATLAGYMFWGTDSLWASLVYNGTYLIPDTIICMVLAVFIAKPVMRVLKGK
jgi:thiamine transporter